MDFRELKGQAPRRTSGAKTPYRSQLRQNATGTRLAAFLLNPNNHLLLPEPDHQLKERLAVPDDK